MLLSYPHNLRDQSKNSFLISWMLTGHLQRDLWFLRTLTSSLDCLGVGSRQRSMVHTPTLTALITSTTDQTFDILD